MTEAKRLLRYMEECSDEFLEVLKGAVLIETPTEGDKGDLEKCRSYFAKCFSDVGFQCSVVPGNDHRYGDHLLMELGQGDEQVLFVGHYDTVYSKGAFGDPWRREGSRLWGPGVLDMKGGDVQVLMVAKALRELDLFPQDKKIVFFLSADEEAGSYSSSLHYKALAQASKAAFVMESARGDDPGGLKIGRFGRGNYTFVANGKSVHSGQEPENAESGLRELARQAIYLEDLTDIDAGVTIACTCLQSGHAGWPTVPGGGALTIDARFATSALAADYDRRLRNLLPFNPRVGITLQGGLEKPPFDEKDPRHRSLYETAQKVGREFGLEMKGIVTRGGSDGNFTASVGCPTLDGMGMTGDFVHQPGKEYINVDQIPVRAAFVARMVLEVLRAS